MKVNTKEKDKKINHLTNKYLNRENKNEEYNNKKNFNYSKQEISSNIIKKIMIRIREKLQISIKIKIKLVMT